MKTSLHTRRWRLLWITDVCCGSLTSAVDHWRLHWSVEVNIVFCWIRIYQSTQGHLPMPYLSNSLIWQSFRKANNFRKQIRPAIPEVLSLICRWICMTALKLRLYLWRSNLWEGRYVKWTNTNDWRVLPRELFVCAFFRLFVCLHCLHCLSVCICLYVYMSVCICRSVYMSVCMAMSVFLFLYMLQKLYNDRQKKDTLMSACLSAV